MRKLGILLIFLAAPHILSAQHNAMIVSTPSINFDSATSLTIADMIADSPDDTTEGGDLRGFNRWANFYKNRVASNAPSTENMLKPAGDALMYYLTNMSGYCDTDPSAFSGNWNCIGPFNDYYGPLIEDRQGRIDAVWVDPNDMGFILAGANMGGLWKSTDTGHTWQNITDPTSTNNSIIPGTMGAHRIAVNPLDRDTIYIALNVMETLRKSGGYAMGLMYTHNGGQTWNVDNSFLTANAQSNIEYFEKWVRKIAYMPGTGDLFAISNDRLLQKPANFSTWTNASPGGGLSSGYYFTDFEFSKLNPGKIIASTNAINNKSSLWVIDVNDPTPTWQELQITLPSPYSQNDDDLIVDISISGADSAYLNIESRVSGVKRMLLIATPITSVGIDIINTNFVTSGSSVFEFIEVSATNPNVIYATVHNGGNSFYRSNNGGISFGDIAPWTHPDGRALTIYHHSDTGANGIGDIIFGGSDGGVVMKKAGQTLFESITGTGLAVTQFYGLSNTEANENFILGGAQDNGGCAYIQNRQEPWEASVTGGDNYMTKFANNGVTEAYTESNPSADLFNITFNATTTTSASVGTPGDLANPTCEYCPQNNLQRPLYFDPGNEAFVGFIDVWTQPLATSSWSAAFSSFPQFRGKTRAFALSEPNKDTAYIAYEDPTWGHNPTNDTFGKLFISIDADTTIPTWTNITPPEVANLGITSITTAPNNLSRIWVALGGVNWDWVSGPDSMKVMYSGNYGATWTDMSKGLPPLPVNKILYLEGSDDILFAGTDVGVFKWSKADGQWYCFNSGLPPVVVNDMEFNYCAGKLRIATFGRGIWETPIIDNNYISTPSNIITTNTTWSSTKYLKSGVRVKTGATLTIQNTAPDQTTIFMPKNGNIIVEAGAKLVVNGARITNGCEDCMWDGIRLIGNRTLAQTASNHGTVELNGAILENAKTAIANYAPTGHSFLTTGGIIVAKNTHFLNNACAVSLEPFTNPTSSPLLKNYKANFEVCTFETNDDFKGGTENRFLSHVAMRGVHGVFYKGCSFYNRFTGGMYQGEGDGIRATNSGFYMRAYCDPFMFPCTNKRNQFTGLRTGIWMEYEYTSQLGSYEIDRCNFDSCSIGIRSLGQHWFTATRDSFRLGYGKTVFLDDFNCHKNIGIWAERSYEPIIEDNSFIGFTHGGQHGQHENLGTVVDNSNEHDKRIYHNSFFNLTRACIARGVNSIPYLPQSSTGLRYLCNTFDDNTYDIQVASLDVHSVNTYQNIAFRQGSSTQSAGNQFLDRGSNKHFLNTSTIYPLNQYYHTGSNTLPILHSNPSWSLITLTNVGAGNANSCASFYPSAGDLATFPATEGILGEYKSGFYDAVESRATAVGTYNGLLDGGNTTDLLAYISTAMVTDSPTVRTTLMGYSPYLSLPVLTAIADAGILQQNVLIAILESNPEMIGDETFLEHLETAIPNPLSSIQIEGLRTASKVISARSEVEGEISDYGMQANHYATLIVNHYLLDTTDSERDSIPVWLDNINTLDAAYQKAAFYTGLGDYSTAGDILGDIPTNFALTGDRETEHDMFVTLWTLMKSVYEDDRTAKEMTGVEIDDMLSILDNPIATGREIGTHIDVISNQYEPMFRIPCSFDMSGEELKPGKQDENNAAKENDRNGNILSKNSLIKAYPNPAKDFVVFEYQLVKVSSGLTLTVTNTTGQKVKEIILDSQTGKVTWDTQNMTSGVYLYKLLDGNKTVDVGRVVLTK